jgi:hypothetical protein
MHLIAPGSASRRPGPDIPSGAMKPISKETGQTRRRDIGIASRPNDSASGYEATTAVRSESAVGRASGGALVSGAGVRMVTAEGGGRGS